MEPDQILTNLRLVLREDWCDRIAAAFEAEQVLRDVYAHAEPRARDSKPAIGCVEWAATFGPLSRAALKDL